MKTTSLIASLAMMATVQAHTVIGSADGALASLIAN